MAVTLTNTPARISSASATSHSPSLGFTPTSGRLLVVGWHAAGGTVTYSNVDPDWTLIHDNTNAGRVHSCGWAYRISDGTETTFSVDVSSAQALVFMFLELDGLAGSSVLDQAAESTANQNSTNATSASTGTTATLSVSDGYALQFFSCDGQAGWDTGRSFTNGSTELANDFNGGGTSSPGMIFAYKVLSSTTGFSETISTTDAGDGMYGSVAVFKQAAGLSSGAATLPVGYAIRSAGSATLAAGFAIRAAGSSSLATGYAIRAGGAATLACGYAIRAGDASTLALGYAIRSAGVAALAAGYSIRSAGASTLAVGYEIEGAAGVGSATLAVGYAIRSAGAATLPVSFAIRSAAYQALPVGYAIRDAGVATLAAGYAIRSAAFSALPVGYAITATGFNTLAVGYAISSSTGGGADPADVWNYVLSNGKTAEETAVETHAMLTALTALLSTCPANLALVLKLLRNKQITDPATGLMTVYDDDGTTVLLQGNLYEDAAGATAYRGQGAERRERLS